MNETLQAPDPSTDAGTFCALCGLSQRLPRLGAGEAAACARCDSPIPHLKRGSLSRTLAFATGALIMYVPANLLPIMSFEYYGAAEETTVWSGVKALTESGMWFLAAVVFLASVAVPLLKLSGLFYLSLTANFRRGAQFRTRLYRVIRAVGTWAMLDIFLLAVLVAAVKLGQLATIRPGPGAVPFALVVALTILATENFDPKLLWRKSPR